jgi:glucosamine--fructose-6-phosphate aminotransferase (isomerizing)
MCGIVGCVGHENAVGYVREGLEALEYRGYDSAGVAYPGAELPSLQVIKEVGSVSKLVVKIPPEAAAATTAIGHTRWATHGKPVVENAHPQTNSDATIAVIHNGTIENHADLKKELETLGYGFKSQTDTEVIPNLISHYLEEGSEPDEAFTKAVRRLEGAYAILGYFGVEPDTIYAARRGSPLVLGVHGSERFAASDHRVINLRTRWATFMDDYELARLSTDEKSYKTWQLEGKKTTRPPEELSGDFELADKGEFPHFMLKEIYDAPQTVRAAISGRVIPARGLVRLGGLEDNPEINRLNETERLVIVGCGTSYHAGLIGERLIEEVAGMPVEVQLASEFQYRQEPIERNTAVLAITQSGETIDTIGALKKAKENHLLTLGVNNSPGSAVDRMTDAGVHCRAGLEVSVASTKAFISQVTVMAELALALGKNNHVSSELRTQLMQELTVIPDKIEQVLEKAPEIEKAAKKYAKYKNFQYIGRGYEHISAMEGALKLKEISYIHAEAYAAGEMKHGPIALVDEDFPTFAIATDGLVYEKTVSNIEEIRARGGPVIALATEGNEKIRDIVDDVIYVPQSMEQTQPILNAVALQLFAYYAAVEKGYNVDRPRNLAKSVTVE